MKRALGHDQKLALIMLVVLAFFVAKAFWGASKKTERPAAPAAPVVETIQEPTIPSYEDYPVDEIYTGTVAAVDFSGNEPALEFKTTIRQQAAKGPNFAGHYTVVSWGCGSACQQNAVIDAKTGVIVAYNLLTTGGTEYRLDSRLLIAREPSPDPEPTPDVAHYYVMREGDLRLNGMVEPGTGTYVPFQAD
ncbi:MAG TPA: hypothetical protein VL283_03830 [Candidatus Baltobacteraceae bacterium]|nr:hypothetical protein [Candidatus Baltobacteraceae bacterium]